MPCRLPAFVLVLVLLALAGRAEPALAQVPDGEHLTPAEVVALLVAESTREEGRRELARLSASLPSDRATLWIRLLATGEQVPGATLGALAPVVLATHQGEHEAALDGVTQVMAGFETDETEGVPPPVLALAAEIADRLDPATGAALRERILAHAPEGMEAGEAALRLARYLLEATESAPRGLRILEDLIVAAPDHPIAPEARRLRQEALARGIEPEPADPSGDLP